MLFKFSDYQNEKKFDFLYEGKPLSNYNCELSQKVLKETSDEIVTESIYTYEFGIKAVRKTTFYPKADSVCLELTLKNVSEKRTGILSRISDFADTFEFEQSTKTKTGYMISEDNIKLFTYQGSTLRHDEFLPAYRYLYDGFEEEIDNRTGRSSDGYMPYFNINQCDRGVIVAVGWSGNWKVLLKSDGKNVDFSSGISGAEFYMEPEESLKMSSVLLTFYDNGYQEGQNKFRNLMKYRVSVIGHVKDPEETPFSLLLWGAMPSENQIKRIKTVNNNELGLNYVWMDAGWYGYSTQRCINEHEGDWWQNTGSWVVNKNCHPDGLLEVSSEIKKARMKFLLWVEPERVIKGSDFTVSHPEWCIDVDKNWDTVLVDYSNPDVLDGIFEIISELIETLEISCYRQDFNVDPLRFWQSKEGEGRHCITQIKHINSLYSLWDRLLERFPDLIIDNCASGGRRLDFELMSRAVAVTRSDYQCGFNPDEMTFQNHTAGSMALLPYLGTYAGFPEWKLTKYNTRSTFAPLYSLKSMTYDNWDIPSEKVMKELKNVCDEYKEIRKYYFGDFYNLIMPWVTEGSWGIGQENRTTPDETVWACWQFNRKEKGDGMILAFRRKKSPYEVCNVSLHDLDPNANYEFSDKDTGEKFIKSGCELMSGGLSLSIENTEESKLLIFRKTDN